MDKRLLAALAALAVLAPAAVAQAAIDKTDNVKVIKTFEYKGTVHPPESTDDYFKGGTDIAWKGKFVYAMQQEAAGGVHVFKRTRRGVKKIAFIACPGGQNDVAVVRKGLIAIGYHTSTCAGAPGGGVRLINVRNPKRPRFLGAVNDLPGGTHTVSVYPGKPIIYANPGGLPTNGDGIEQILDVSNPKKPKVAATFTPSPNGCHDVTFFFKGDQKLAFCAGEGETQIWDVTDPLAPVTITHIPHGGQMVFPHSVAITHDGHYAVIGDENFEVHQCDSEAPTGALWIYDISTIEAPVLVGYHSVGRGQAVVAQSRQTWCTAHLFNFIPKTYVLVVSWYAAGMNVLDLSDPSAPEELAYYFGTEEDYTNYWSAYWYKGLIWANDRTRGLDVFKVKGLPPKK